MGVGNGAANYIGDIGAGSMGVGGVGGVGVDGPVCARVTSGMTLAREVAFPRGSGAAFCGDSHASSSRDSGHILVDARKVACWTWISVLARVDVPVCPH